MEKELKNARIESTMLGTESHGILSFMLSLRYDGCGQGFGGYALDEWKGERGAGGRRVGCAFGMEFIRRVLEVLEVAKWEDLPGTPCRVIADYTKVYRLGHYLKDKWVDPEVIAKEMATERIARTICSLTGKS